ncbi:molybdopterin-guanine dinucleotide biosynthesis protein B [Halalkalibacter lacteus]|uniref:molybdopterin-guanine dinucleotide biosynthesis protein B n=1 Tax=Halalkalibacter lacteus TaxID=3090663 RepID=UPI002FC7AF17
MALERYCPILQVVGYQNSGKTTLMEKLITKSADQGLHVASIKHHGHQVAQKNEIRVKDSQRHQQAGATITAVEGGGSLQIHSKNQSWSLEKLLKLYEHFSPDLIFVEGYKKEQYPKVVLLRGEKDVVLLHEVTNILCAITWKPLSVTEVEFPIFDLEDSSSYVEFILQKLSDEYETSI